MIRLLNKLCGGNVQEFTDEKEVMAHWEALLKHFNKRAMGFHKLESLSAQEADNIRERVIFVIGDKDPIAYKAESVELLNDSRMNYKIVENAGHALNYEKPGTINRLIKDFILG